MGDEQNVIRALSRIHLNRLDGCDNSGCLEIVRSLQGSNDATAEGRTALKVVQTTVMSRASVPAHIAVWGPESVGQHSSGTPCRQSDKIGMKGEGIRIRADRVAVAAAL